MGRWTDGPLLERLTQRVQPDPDSGCHLWIGSIDAYGYGRFKIRIGDAWQYRRAHRLFYEIKRGPIPDGLQLDHLCRVRPCVNPEHLEAVDCRTNLLRGETIPAANAAKTHCPSGHAYSGNNLQIDNGARRCAECKRKREARRYALAKSRNSGA